MRVRSVRIAFIVVVLSIISGCLSICDARPTGRNSDRSQTSTSTQITEKPNGSGPIRPSAGLVVAVFVLVLAVLILLTCVCIWVVGKCRNWHREAWNDVYDSIKPFPTKKTRFCSDDEDETNWRGPPPFEINILIPESSTSDREINGLAHLDDPTTRMGQVDDAAAAISPDLGAVATPKPQLISEMAKADDVQEEGD